MAYKKSGSSSDKINKKNKLQYVFFLSSIPLFKIFSRKFIPISKYWKILNSKFYLRKIKKLIYYVCKIVYIIELSYQNINCRVELWNATNVFHTFVTFYVTQMIYPFLNSSILSNDDKVEEYSAYGEIYIKGIDTLF